MTQMQKPTITKDFLQPTNHLLKSRPLRRKNGQRAVNRQFKHQLGHSLANGRHIFASDAQKDLRKHNVHYAERVQQRKPVEICPTAPQPNKLHDPQRERHGAEFLRKGAPADGFHSGGRLNDD